MPRVCTVCIHPDRDKIDRALLTGQSSLRDIARRCRVSKDALARHKADHLPVDLTRARQAEEVARADDLLAQVRAIMARVNKLFDACDEWLRDPDDPGRYDLGPRADEVTVTYLSGKIWKKARLSELLAETGRSFKLVEVKTADPRRLILETARTLQGSLEMLTKIAEIKGLETRLEILEEAIEEREQRWTSGNGSQGPRRVLIVKR